MNPERPTSELELSILKTIAFFDLFDYPLTDFEIWQYLDRSVGFFEVKKALESGRGRLMPALGSQEGFYFVRGRENLVRQRQLTYHRANQASARARSVFFWLRFLSGTRLLAVCNNFYYTPASDIDVFVVTASKRLWSTRFWLTLITHLSGHRRHGKKIINRLCLSFYVSEDAADLSALTLEDDPYFYYWLAFLEPLYHDGYLPEFWQANSWISAKLPNFVKADSLSWSKLPLSPNLYKLSRRRFYSGSWGGFWESLWRFWERRKMSLNRHSLASAPDTRVVISDTVLKFHEGDRRQTFAKRLAERLQSLSNI